MKGPETRLRKKIVAALKEEWPHMYIRKIHGSAFQNIGIPDLLGCVEGLFVGLEVKRRGKIATPAQELEIAAIIKAKGAASVVRGPEEAVKFVRQALIRLR